MMAARRQILLPVVLPLLLAGLLAQAVLPLLRLVMTYQVLDQGMGPQVVALLSAVFSLLPIFFSVAIGRFNDTGAIALSPVFGAVAMMAGCLMMYLPPGLPVLLVVSATLGLANTLFVSSLQMIAASSSSRAHRDSVLGNYMVAMSLGQALGPMFIGLTTDPFWLYLTPVLGSVVVLVATLALLRAVPRRKGKTSGVRIPLSRIAATRGLPWIILTGSICVTALDLLLAFMPVLGEMRGWPPATVGLLLGVRAAGSMLSRLMFGRAVRWLGRMRLMLLSTGLAGIGLVTLALPLPLWLGIAAMSGVGVGLGIALTSSVALTMQIAPPSARGTALSLRLTANRLAQFCLPLLAGLAVVPLGGGGIFALTGLVLLAAPLARPRGLSG